MPVILRFNGCRFFFYSNEGDPLEPIHIHVQKAEKLAKFWVRPELTLAESYGFSSKELKQLLHVVKQNATLIERKWNEYFHI